MHAIKVGSSADRSFLFPGKLPVAYAYYADVGRLLSYLPRICLVRAHGLDRFRLLYNSTELGIYHIQIFADVQAVLEEGRVLHIRPLNGVPPVRAQADVHSATAQGYFYSRSVFHDEGEQTRIEYHLQLQADLPVPTALRLVPVAMMARVATSITHKHIHDISEGFIERSIDAFPYWLAEIENHNPHRSE
jgi:hypothetical protein